MKYIITENRLKEFMFNYLDSYMDSNPMDNWDNFIVISQPDENGEDFHAAIEFDHEDGRLWIDRKILEYFMDLFGQSVRSAQETIKEWFQNKFNVEVLYTQS